MIHIYCGDGKGKTTAAVGLSLRAVGAGKCVRFVQFFKTGSSSEIGVLSAIEGVQTLYSTTRHGFFKNMDDAAKEKAQADYTALLEQALTDTDAVDLLVLDEVISACNHGMVPLTRLADFLSNVPDTLEIVLTGRDPTPALLALADYVTEMKKIKHPFDRGIRARRGIEF